MNKQTPLPPLKANKRRLGCCSIRFIITSFDESFRYTSLQKFSFSVLRRNIHHFTRSSSRALQVLYSTTVQLQGHFIIIRLVCTSNILRVSTYTCLVLHFIYALQTPSKPREQLVHYTGWLSTSRSPSSPSW